MKIARIRSSLQKKKRLMARNGFSSLVPRLRVGLGCLMAFCLIGLNSHRFSRQTLASDALRTVVVVNHDSVDSLTIANHYAKLRQISQLNIIALDNVPDSLHCSVADFRSRILQPLLKELDARGLGAQADIIAYSAGFPTAIDIAADLKKVDSLPRVFTPTGSLNGLTMLYLLVMAENPEYVAPLANYYARQDPTNLLENPFIGTQRTIFDEAMQAAKDQDFAKAIETLTPVAAQHRFQWPLAFRIACWQAAGGKHDEAFAALQKLVEAGVVYRKLLDEAADLDSLRDHETFARLHDQASPVVPNRWPAAPFSGRLTFGRNGLPLQDPQQGLRYLLSTALAVTGGRGTTVAEAIAQLERTAAADGSGKPAAFYFSNHKDVRAQTRMPLVPLATVHLRERGHRVLIDTQTLPVGVSGVMGAMLGAANYDWPAAKVGLLPGAIVENLTSTSGVLHASSGQTPMSVLIRAGAAGTSGTVTEPYALQFKFPTPLLYAYYAAGCTLAEAFHLSVESPYQLLIVGDPLCRPYSPVADATFSLLQRDSGDQVELALQLPEASAPSDWVALELFVNGRLLRVAPLAEKLTLDKSSLPPGVHEIQLALVSRHPLQPRLIQTIPISGQSDAIPKLTATLAGEGAEATIQLQVQSTTGQRLAVRHLGRRLVEEAGQQATWTVPVSRTGYGPLRLTPETLDGETWVPGEPVWIEVPLPADKP